MVIALLDHSLDFVAVGVWGRVGDIGVEETKIGCKGKTDGFRVRTEAGYDVPLRVVGRDQATEAVYHVNTFFGLGSEDCHEAAMVVYEDQGLRVTTDRSGREELEVEEDALPNSSGGRGGAGGMKVLVVELTDCAS